MTTLPFTSPRYQFDERKTFWQIFVCFIYHLRTLSKTIKAFFGKQSAALSKWLSTCPMRFFAENFFSEKVLFLFQHWALSELFLSFRRKFVGQVVSTAFCLSIRPDCCEKSFVKNFFPIIFGHWSQNDQSLFDFFSARLTTLHSTGARDQFEELRPFWKTLVCFIYHLRTLSQKIKAFFRKTINRFVKIAHHVSKGIFCREFFSKKIFFYLIIGHWSTFVCHFDENLSVPLSVLLSVCHLDHFVVKKNLSNFFSPSVTDMYRKIIGLCWNFFRPNWRHCFLQVRRINLKSNICFEKFLYVFLSFSNIEREINGFFVGKQIAVLPKLLTTC